MDTLVIISTIRAGFEFGTELLRFMQTEQGAKLIQQSIEDRAKWDAFWKEVGNGLEKFFTGKLFAIPAAKLEEKKP